MERKNRNRGILCHIVLVMVLLLVGCGGPDDADNEAKAADAEGCWMTPRELSMEEIAAIDLVSSDKDVGYGIFDYHFDDFYDGMNVCMSVYQNGGPQAQDSLIVGISFDEFSRNGELAVVMEETGCRTKIRDDDGFETSGSWDAQDYLKINGNGGRHTSSREGVKDADNHIILYTVGVYEGAARHLSQDADITKAINEDIKKFDTYIVFYAEGY